MKKIILLFLLSASSVNAQTIGSPSGGTVTSVGVATANGVSGSVANSTTAPSISLTLGAITPTSVITGVISGSSYVAGGTAGIISCSVVTLGATITIKAGLVVALTGC